jgi:hypothetical protein
LALTQKRSNTRGSTAWSEVMERPRSPESAFWNQMTNWMGSG